MNRNFYFIGIAFFGTINGVFNQLWLIFALLYVQPLAGPLLFGSLSLTLMFASLMVSTATVILGGIPAAIYERATGAPACPRSRAAGAHGCAVGAVQRHGIAGISQGNVGTFREECKAR